MGGIGGIRGLGRLAHCCAQYGAVAAACVALAACSGSSSRLDPKYGVSSSARVVEPGEPIPKGGGVYRVGKPYTVAGKLYVPEENVNYSAVGMASFYGEDFHGRYTANGEIFDMNSITAAHPTLPLPSYVRVTNLGNHKSIVVRVNDRGPYVGDRVIDLSVQTAKLLGFYGHGLAKVKVDYVGRAPLTGSDDRKLMATLREGVPAAAPSVQVAATGDFSPTFFDNRPITQAANLPVPSPPDRPFRLGEGARDVPSPVETQIDRKIETRPEPKVTTASATLKPKKVDFAVAGPPVRVSQAHPAVSPVSAYAPPRYDSSTGFMSGRGLY